MHSCLPNACQERVLALSGSLEQVSQGWVIIRTFSQTLLALRFVKQSQVSAALNFLSATNEGFVSAQGFGNPIEEELTDQSLSNFRRDLQSPYKTRSACFGCDV